MISAGLEKLYSCFSNYTTVNMQACTCGCISDEQIRRLNAKPLRVLSLDDLGFYHHKAMTTWGDVPHYKHFLPRILELYVSKRDNPQFGLEEITCKLNEAAWTEWPEEERNTIKEFMLSDWSERNQGPSAEITLSELELYNRFIDANVLMYSWDTANHAGIENFVDFIYNYGNLLPANAADQAYPFHQKHIREFVEGKGLIEKLHDEFFAYESRDPAYAEKISIVLQVLEH